MAADDKIMALNAEYPCCGRHARFSDDDERQHVVTRYCQNDDITYYVYRQFGRRTKAGTRLDRLTWREKIR